MDYEEKYKQALERAREQYNKRTPLYDIESIFPELKESEDEKIRKAIIRILKGETRCVSMEDTNKYVTWLEKQGEQTTDKIEANSAWSEEDEEMLMWLCRIIHAQRLDKAITLKEESELGEWIDKWLNHNPQPRQCKHLENFDEAEKEKHDFVSGQFLQCRKSFDKFIENDSYWLEYIGNDTYIGRSDNILNQKFHITPRQLYCLFTQQHYYLKENNINKEANAPTAYGKYVDECLNEASKHFFSDGEDKYSVADLFYAGVRCGKFWFEKQDYNKEQINLPCFTFDDVLALQCCMETVKKVQENKELYEKLKDLHSKVYDIYQFDKQGEAESKNESTENESTDTCDSLIIKSKEFPASEKRNFGYFSEFHDKVEPKFKVGDWCIDNKDNTIFQIVKVLDYTYAYRTNEGKEYFGTHYSLENDARLWSIEDAKDGDLIYVSTEVKGIQAIFHKFENGIMYFHCNLCRDFMQGGYEPSGDVEFVNPLPKTHYKRFFQTMKDAGYEWDADKKELSKQTLQITPKFCVGQVITDDNGTWYKITKIKCLDDWHYELYDVGKATTHHELCSIIDEKFRENRFVGEIKKMMGD